MVIAAPKNRKAVAYTKIGVLTETDDEKQWLGVAVDACMAVEVVTVVEVSIRGAHVADGLGDLMYRVVVERGQCHRASPVVSGDVASESQ